MILVEGPTEEVILRAYLQEVPKTKFYFILNCGTVNNIPFYQRVLSQFSIPYSVICDTDMANIVKKDESGNPSFDSGIQKSISDQFSLDFSTGKARILRCHVTTFEPAHKDPIIPEYLRMPDASSHGKPFDANKYWKEKLQPNLEDPQISLIPIMSAMQTITG